MSFDATIGGASATSYLDVATAQAYFDGRLNVQAWTDAGVADRQKALQTATARLEQERWLGTKASFTQALAWPRANVRNPDFGGIYGYGGGYYDWATIPPPLQRATCELVLSLLAAGDQDPLLDQGLAGMTSLRLGPLSLSKAPEAGTGDLPATVRRLIAPMCATPSGMVRIVRS